MMEIDEIFKMMEDMPVKNEAGNAAKTAVMNFVKAHQSSKEAQQLFGKFGAKDEANFKKLSYKAFSPEKLKAAVEELKKVNGFKPEDFKELDTAVQNFEKFNGNNQGLQQQNNEANGDAKTVFDKLGLTEKIMQGTLAPQDLNAVLTSENAQLLLNFVKNNKDTSKFAQPIETLANQLKANMPNAPKEGTQPAEQSQQQKSNDPAAEYLGDKVNDPNWKVIYQCLVDNGLIQKPAGSGAAPAQGGNN